jgi:hypothetical protein
VRAAPGTPAAASAVGRSAGRLFGLEGRRGVGYGRPILTVVSTLVYQFGRVLLKSTSMFQPPVLPLTVRKFKTNSDWRDPVIDQILYYSFVLSRPLTTLYTRSQGSTEQLDYWRKVDGPLLSTYFILYSEKMTICNLFSFSNLSVYWSIYLTAGRCQRQPGPPAPSVWPVRWPTARDTSAEWDRRVSRFLDICTAPPPLHPSAALFASNL